MIANVYIKRKDLFKLSEIIYECKKVPKWKSSSLDNVAVHWWSASDSVFIQISSCVLRNFTDRVAHKLISSGRVGPKEGICISSDKHSLESELNVEEIKALLDLIYCSECLCNFGRESNTQICKQFEDTGGSNRINAIVQCLGFGISGHANQAKDEWVSWLIEKRVPDIWNVDGSLRVNIATLKVRYLWNKCLSETEDILQPLISPDYLVVVWTWDASCIGKPLVHKSTHESDLRAGAKTNFGSRLGYQ
jgi:hypothetical protein